MPATDRFTDLEAARFEEDMRMAAGFKPIMRSELEKGYKRYESVGVKFGTIKKYNNDTYLYKKATAGILAWYKKQKAGKAVGPYAPVPTAAKPAAQAAPKPQVPTASYVRSRLAESGFANARPPAYALSSVENFEAWIERAFRNAQ